MINLDYIPDSDPGFNIWQANLINAILENNTRWNISSNSIDTLLSAQTVWNTAYEKACNFQSRSRADVRAKNEAREAYQKTIRNFVGEYLSRNSNITNSDREGMQLTIRSGHRTPPRLPDTSPIGSVDFSVRQQHTVRFINNGAGGKGKPYGVLGCEIWLKNGGDEPLDDKEFIYRGMVTKSPHKIIFTGADIGNWIYYRLRWINKRGQPGPWSNIFSAIVGG